MNKSYRPFVLADMEANLCIWIALFNFLSGFVMWGWSMLFMVVVISN